MEHLGWIPAGFEFHAHEIWNGQGYWARKTPPELLAALESIVSVLDELEISVVHASIDKARLHTRHNGARDCCTDR